MGRSQVERNRIHGRPGTKGGRGGTTSRPNDKNKSKRKHDHAENLGSNSYRYDKSPMPSSTMSDSDQTDNDISSMMETLSSGNEFGLSHYSVASDLLYKHHKEDFDDPSSFVNSNSAIDVKSLSKIMEDDSSYKYLRFDARMTELFLKRFANETGLMTIAESRLCGTGQNLNDVDVVDTIEDDGMDAKGGEDEENLEDFLDDLIGA